MGLLYNFEPYCKRYLLLFRVIVSGLSVILLFCEKIIKIFSKVIDGVF